MIVCVCHHVSEHRINQSIADGSRSLKALAEELGVARSCGKCAHQCKSLLREAHQAPVATLGFGELALNP